MKQHTAVCMRQTRGGRDKFTAFAVLSFACLAGLATLMGCQQPGAGELDQALALYRQNQLSEALPLLEQAVNKNSKNAEAHAWLAETYRRLGRKDEAVQAAKRAIALDPCHSFAHTVLGDACNPMYGAWEDANPDSTWAHLLKAVACDSTEGNAWVSIWTEAMRRDELPMVKRSLAAAARSGFFTTAALAYSRWMLGVLPEHAVLVTNGDMDTYPAVVLQEVENFRPDVAVVNRSLLNTSWYARFLRDHRDLTLPFADARLDSLVAFKDSEGKLLTPSDQILQAWLAQKRGGVFARPLAFSVTVDPSATAAFQDQLQMAGPVWFWHSGAAAAVPDTATLRRGLAGITPGDFSGAFVSPQDRSPVRRVYTKGMVRNITASVLTLAKVLIQSGNAAEAEQWLLWAEAFEKQTEVGPAFSEQIASLTKEARKSLAPEPQQ